MMATLATLTVKLTGDTDPFVKALQGAQQRATSFAGGIINSLGRIGLAGAGLGVIVDGAKSAGAALGLGLNAELENTKAQLVAFTKDGAAADKILQDIKTEAATTPFAFNEMAAATAGLMPAAKTSGVALMDLVKQAEILAASNPAQGLEGAAFALREAVGGDFTSVIERFNLPRGMINKLKAEGVPALQAVGMAMKSMGFDTDLVSNLSNTASGRWSTLMDTFDTLRASLSKPLFDMLSKGLGALQPMLDAAMPKLEAWATKIGTGFVTAVSLAGKAVMAFATGQGFDQLYTAIGKAFGKDVLDSIGKFIDPLAKFRATILPELVAKTQELIDKGGALVKFFQDNTLAADALTAAIGAGLAVKIGAMTLALAAQIPILYAQAAAATASAVATAAAAAPFIALGVVLGAVILAGIEVARNWELITFVAETTAKLVVLRFTELKDGAVNAFTSTVDAAGSFASGVWEAIKDGIGKAVAFVSAGLGAIPGVFGAAWQAATDVTTALVQGIYDFIYGTIPYWASFVAGWLSDLPGIMKRLFTEAKDAVLTALGAAWDWLVQNVPTWPGKIGAFLATVGGFVRDRFNEAKTALTTALGAAWSWVTENVPTWPGKIGAFLASLGGFVLAKLTEAKDAVVNTLGAAWDWIALNVPTWPGKIGDFLKSLPAAIGTALSGVWDALTGPFTRAWDTIKGTLDKIGGASSAGFAAGQAAGAAAAAGGAQQRLQSVRVGPQPIPFFDRAGAALAAGQQKDFDKLNFKTSSEFNDILRSESANQQIAARLAAEDAYAASIGTTRSELGTHLDMLRQRAEAVVAGGATRDRQIEFERQQYELAQEKRRREELDQKFLLVRLDVNGRQLGGATTRDLVRDAYKLVRNGAMA